MRILLNYIGSISKSAVLHKIVGMYWILHQYHFRC